MRLLISLITILLPLSASAQPPEGQDWWACQSVESAGLNWEDRQWKTTRFKSNERFILIAEGDGLQKESVAKAMGTSTGAIECPEAMGLEFFTYCIDEYMGTSFAFHSKNGQGTIATIFGGVQSSDRDDRDSLTVMPFECTKG